MSESVGRPEQNLSINKNVSLKRETIWLAGVLCATDIIINSLISRYAARGKYARRELFIASRPTDIFKIITPSQPPL